MLVSAKNLEPLESDIRTCVLLTLMEWNGIIVELSQSFSVM